MTLRCPAPWEKKKLAASLLLLAHRSAMVCAIADFPDPAGPLSQHTGRSLPPSIQCMMFAITSSRVPCMHPAIALQLSYAASGTGLRNALRSEVGEWQTDEL